MALLGQGQPVRQALGDGRLFVDHAVPILAVHRCAGTSSGDPALDRRAACTAAHRLITTGPAYLLATGGPAQHEGVRRFAAAVTDALAEQVGRVLLVEVWAPLDESQAEEVDPFRREPGFTLYVPDDPDAQAVAPALADALSGVELAGQGATVRTVDAPEVAPPGLPPLLDDGPRVVTIGLAVDAVFLNAEHEEFYPGVLEALRAGLAPALATAGRTFASLTGANRTLPARPMGRHHLEPAAEQVDAGLAACSGQYGFLLQVTPVNVAEAWDEFREGGCARPPELLYRPFTFDPDAIRRALFALPVDEIEDPVVAGLLREKRDEIEIEIRMILDRETDQFLPGSLRLFPAPDEDLVTLALALAEQIAAGPAPPTGVELVGPTAFAAAAEGEFAYYRAQHAGFASGVEVRTDLPGSLMVSDGVLLIGAGARIRADRVAPLLAHEVGTHVLTHANGAAQPLRQLRDGLAGYEPLQEGLAVLAEWLVGGLTRGRMRTLAARVLGADALVRGADFMETFALLKEQADLSDRASFGVTVRLYRGGGLTKDAVYLRGLRDLLAHLGAGGAFWPLFAGKLALHHLSAVQTLRARGILQAPPLRPRYAADARALARLDRTRAGLSVQDLLADA